MVFSLRVDYTVNGETKKRILHCEELLTMVRISKIIRLVEPTARVTGSCWITYRGVIGPMTYCELKWQSTRCARDTVVKALLDYGYGEHIDDYLVGEPLPIVVQGFVYKVLSNLGKDAAEAPEFLEARGVKVPPLTSLPFKLTPKLPKPVPPSFTLHYPPGEVQWLPDKELPADGKWYFDGQWFVRHNADDSLDEELT